MLMKRKNSDKVFIKTNKSKYNFTKILDSKKIYNSQDINSISVDDVYNLI